MTQASEAIMERAREKRRLRNEKRGVAAQSRTWSGKMFAWARGIAKAAVCKIRMFLRWPTHRKPA
jgi:hypothetical protein